MQECTLLESFDHVNIVPFFGVVCDDTTAMEPLYLAMQYVPSGTLQDLIHSERYVEMRSDEGRLPLVTQALALLGLFSALEYLAERNLIHRDVKPANILAVVEEAGNLSSLSKVLLADFGEAKQLTRSMSRVSAAGTPVYMAPEMAEEDEAKTPKADVFSAGVVAVEMNTGKSPSPGPAMKKEGRRRVAVVEEERRMDDLAAVHDPQITLIAERCIVDDEDERADAAEMVQDCRDLLEQQLLPIRDQLLRRGLMTEELAEIAARLPKQQAKPEAVADFGQEQQRQAEEEAAAAAVSASQHTQGFAIALNLQ